MPPSPLMTSQMFALLVFLNAIVFLHLPPAGRIHSVPHPFPVGLQLMLTLLAFSDRKPAVVKRIKIYITLAQTNCFSSGIKALQAVPAALANQRLLGTTGAQVRERGRAMGAVLCVCFIKRPGPLFQAYICSH